MQKKASYGSGEMSTIYNYSDNYNNSVSIPVYSGSNDSRLFDSSMPSKQISKLPNTITHNKSNIVKYLNKTQNKGFHLSNKLSEAFESPVANKQKIRRVFNNSNVMITDK